MNSNNYRTLQFCVRLEQTLDQHLFGKEEEDYVPNVKDDLKILGGGYAATAALRGTAGAIHDRRSGLRATVPGFAGQSPFQQSLKAAGSVLREDPRRVVRGVGSTIASDARKTGSFLASGGRVAAQSAAPLLARLKGLAGRLALQKG